MLDGRSQGLVAFYLNDDLMAPVGDYWWAPGAQGKYGGGGSNPPNLVQMDFRLGLDTETSYSEIAPALPLWDANHRGDGVTSWRSTARRPGAKTSKATSPTATRSPLPCSTPNWSTTPRRRPDAGRQVHLRLQRQPGPVPAGLPDRRQRRDGPGLRPLHPARDRLLERRRRRVRRPDRHLGDARDPAGRGGVGDNKISSPTRRA
jgi:hypothetical protein